MVPGVTAISHKYHSFSDKQPNMQDENGESEPQNRRGGSFWRTFRRSSGCSGGSGSGSFCEKQIYGAAIKIRYI